MRIRNTKLKHKYDTPEVTVFQTDNLMDQNFITYSVYSPNGTTLLDSNPVHEDTNINPSGDDSRTYYNGGDNNSGIPSDWDKWDAD